MRSWDRVIGFALLPLALLSCQVSRVPKSAEESKRELLALENRWLQVENDPVALEGILAPDFLHVVRGQSLQRPNTFSLYANILRVANVRTSVSKICT
jgi:hypothetical protein